MTAPARKRILVVDDSPLMRRLITEIVEVDPDLQVVDVAENGRVALQKVRQLQPDCVLLDIEMPELSGLDTLRRLRLRSSARVVILSYLGQEGSRVRAQALRLGAADVIDKPTAAVSPDLRTTRGSIIQQTLRRVLGLPAAPVPVEPLPGRGALATASILAVHVHQVAALCERVEVPALVELLDEPLAITEQMARQHGGILDGQLGGVAVAAFGVPTQRTDHAARAVAAGTAILERLAARRAERQRSGQPFLDAGVAVLTGLVLAAELGPSGARRYRTVGAPVDVAVRLARATEDYGAELVVCGRTLIALGAAASRRLDVVELERDGAPVEVHEVLSSRVERDHAAIEAYARGLEHYEAGQFARAIKAFDEVLQRSPADRAAARLSSRCRALLATPSTTWRGAGPLAEGG